MPQADEGQRLALNGIQAGGHGGLDGGIGGDFRLIGPLAHVRVGAVGQAADGGKGLFLPVEFDEQARVQLIPQSGEGAAAGHLHAQHGILQRRVNDVSRVLLEIGKQILVGLQIIGMGGVDCDILVRQIAAQGAHDLLIAHVHDHQPLHQAVGVLIVDIGGIGEGNKQRQLREGDHHVGIVLQEGLHVRRARELFRPTEHFLQPAVDARQIRFEGLVLKAVFVKLGKIPIHKNSPPVQICFYYITRARFCKRKYRLCAGPLPIDPFHFPFDFPKSAAVNDRVRQKSPHAFLFRRCAGLVNGIDIPVRIVP